MKRILTACLILIALALPLSLPLYAKDKTPRVHRHIPWGPIIRGALNITATVMDVEGTQRCLRAGTCIEGNPAMPTNPRIVWPLEMTITGASTFMDFESWKQDRRWGWIEPIVGITEHTVGAVTGWTK